jgi:hypothetical protein
VRGQPGGTRVRFCSWVKQKKFFFRVSKNTFLKELLESDFAFVNRTTSTNHINGQIIGKRVNFCMVSPQFLIRDLSVWIKSLNYLKKKNGSVTVLVHDNSVYELFAALVTDANLQKKIFVIKSVQHLPQTSKLQNLIILDNILATRNLLHAINSNLFFATHFSVVKTKRSLGRYRVFSHVSGFKKIIFIFLILKNVFASNEKK